MMGKLIQKKQFPFSHNNLFAIYNIRKSSLAYVEYFHIIMAVKGKMNKPGMGADCDQLSFLQHLIAVNGKIASRRVKIQNLLENIIYSLVTGRGNQNKINQTTMGLIFLYLMDSVQYVEMRLPNQYENMISMTTLDYIEQKYRTATLTELCDMLHLPMHVLSKMIKKTTGFNFKELLQRKRLSKAVELMCDTDLPISDIIAAVGYENNSYFHRVFKERYGVTPRAFRVANKKNDKVRL